MPHTEDGIFYFRYSGRLPGTTYHRLFINIIDCIIYCLCMLIALSLNFVVAKSTDSLSMSVHLAFLPRAITNCSLLSVHLQISVTC